jgi:hypothetical protein
MHDYAICNAQSEMLVSGGGSPAMFQAAQCAWQALIFMQSLATDDFER